MNIGLLAVDSRYPNLALMKISRYHKAHGDKVEWYTPFSEGRYDRVYMSKIFTFTQDYEYPINNADEILRGGTGYDLTARLPDEIDRLQPDYSIYNVPDDLAYGFLTRGCVNHCRWCVVPKKEGYIRPYMDIEEIIEGGRKKAILMDNNILASDYGLSQIEKIVRLGVRVDFNQALDARLIDDEKAELLSKVKWFPYIRMGCDTEGQIPAVEKAVTALRRYGYNGDVMLYCILLDDFNETLSRVEHWKHFGDPHVVPYCQPYRDFNNPMQKIPQWQKDMARWADRKELYRTCDFKDYSPRKGFRCEEYILRYGQRR